MIKRTINYLLFFVGVLLVLNVGAEGSFQVGLNQPLRDYDASDERFFVDILSAGEVINVHLCGDKDEDDVRIRIYDPSNNLVLDTARTQSNIACNHTLDTVLNNPVQYTALTAGAYSLALDNQGDSGDRFNLRRVDISVTATASIRPDPSASSGRLWALKWVFDTDSFAQALASNADYYPLVTGGRANTNYVWKLDLNNFSGNVYEIIANDIGVEAPRSGYSTAIAENDVKARFPIYLSYPLVAKPRPQEPPVINIYRFIDTAGQDNAISPSVSAGIQDSGVFEFTSDVNATYAIIIDSNNDAVYDADDVLLLGRAVAGDNQVSWNGKDASGQNLPAGNYRARLQLRLGEYHFIGRDVETSGGPGGDGLTIYLANSDGSTMDTYVFWNDKTFLNGTSTMPTGALSSTPEGKHSWGDFSSTSIGNISFMDTYVYGLSTTDITSVTISTSDELQPGVDGSVSVSPVNSQPGDTITVVVSDADLNLNSSVIESIVVHIVNASSAETEALVLTETTAGSGVFSSDISTEENATAGINNNASINVKGNDVLTVTYLDQRDSAGASISRTASVEFVVFTDEDGDGITDADEGTGDTDGDGIADFMDPDSDNDGIDDIIERNVDTDNDGIPDYKELDSDNDGVPDAIEGAADSDGDGIADYLDLDSDNDGLSDIREAGGIDADNNGQVDGFTDNDNDGIDDSLAISPLPTIDTDKDGVPDYRDRDSDNDGVPDLSEGDVDTDRDGVADYHDLDSDNDGIPDLTEAGGKDSDGNGRVDKHIDDNGDGLDDHLASVALPDRDSDNDGIPDRRDLNSDQVAANDLLEAGGMDSDNDGMVDGFTDINGDGYDDMLSVTSLTLPDSDNDGIPDFQDNDDFDNDGITDSVDLDDDNDGIPDSSEAVNDSDSDGIADSLEHDSDNDGISDLVEAGGIDRNLDGMLDTPVDNNADGLDDTIATRPLADTDTDGDGLVDRRQTDSDSDSIPDAIEGKVDTDADGIPDYRDLDSDNDSIPDAREAARDTDNDGIADFRDLDSDNDGIDDIIEAGGMDSNTDARVDNPVDVNGDGLADSVSTTALADKDTDSDGLPDRQDLDSDNDSVVDLVEVGGIDSNGDGKVDGFIDANGDGRDDTLARTPLALLDSDSDGTPDFQDNEKGIESGLKGVGGGCTLASQSTSDPMLPLLILLSVITMSKRIRERNRKKYEKP